MQGVVEDSYYATKELRSKVGVTYWLVIGMSILMFMLGLGLVSTAFFWTQPANAQPVVATVVQSIATPQPTIQPSLSATATVTTSPVTTPASPAGGPGNWGAIPGELPLPWVSAFLISSC